MSDHRPPIQDLLFRRKFRNYLLDARFQLKFAGFFILITTLVALQIGIFLWRTTDSLFEQMNGAVESRAKVAQVSKELGTCSLNNDLAKNLDDPGFTAELEARSRSLDDAFEKESQAVQSQRTELLDQQRSTFWLLLFFFSLFVVTVGLFSIAITHRIVGPLFRIKRMTRDVAKGSLALPTYGLRPGDELKDLFELYVEMLTQLRNRTEADIASVQAGLGGDSAALEKLKGELEARLK